MAELTKRGRRRAEEASDDAQEKVSGGGEAASNGSEGASNGSRTITSELMDTFRDSAIEVLKPVMKKATTTAAKYAVTHGPELVKGKLGDAGGAGEIVSKLGGAASGIGGAASNLMPGKSKDKGKDKAPSGTGRGRRLPVEETVDVAVDLETAYDQFTQFEDWPKFMHRVERIEQRDETTLMWEENIWGVRRSWEVEIVEQTPCERIVWRSKNGPMTIGVASFHRISDNLTRIMVTVDFQPKGLFEKTASGTRISRRALSSDLMRLKAYLELHDEATGEWKGRIEDGELVDDEERDDSEDEPRDEAYDEEEDAEEDSEADEDEDSEPEAEEDEEPEAEEDEEPEAEEDEEPEAEGDEEPEAEEDEDYEDEDEESEPEAEADDDDTDARAEDEEEQEAPRRKPRARKPRAKRAPRRKREDDENPEAAPKPRRRRRAATAKG